MAGVLFDLWGQGGWPSVEVAGEQYHKGEIARLLPRQIPEGGVEIEVECQLVPEPRNRHDRNAIRVESGGQLLGYLSREDAARYVAVLSGLVAQGFQPKVAGRIWAQRGWSGPEPYVQVRVDLAEPHMLVPLNLPPSGRHVLLPHGSAVQVGGEEQHLDALGAWTRPEGEAWVHASLHALQEQTARTSRTVVEVRIDGARVGQLTPKMSGEWLPVIDLLAGTDTTCLVRAIVKGNALKADVTLHAARAGELSADFMASLQAAASLPRAAGPSSAHSGAQEPPRQLQEPGYRSAPPPQAPAAWYADPVREAALRWWDGNSWTEHVHS